MVRFKHRYFVVELIPTQKSDSEGMEIHQFALTDCILKMVQDLHGDFGIAAVKSGFRSKYCNPITRVGVIRARHGPHRLVASSLPFIKSIGRKNKPISIRTLYTGATLRHCFKFTVEHQKRKLMKVWNGLPNEFSKSNMKSSILDLSPFQDLEKFNVPLEYSGQTMMD